jgi:membrane protein DedA with SNARE-associated domain
LRSCRPVRSGVRARGVRLKSLVNSILYTFFGWKAYVAVFALLVACGLGLPLPEDISLVTGGFFAASGRVGSVWLMMFVGLAGILVGDSIIFLAGQRYGEALLDTQLGRHIPRERVDNVRALFAKHGSKMIMAARFLPGVRAVTYFVAGTSRVSIYVFLLYDGLAALVSAPAWVWLGYWMGKQHVPRKAYAIVEKFQKVLICVVAVVLLALLVRYLFKRRRAGRQAPAKVAPLVAGAAKAKSGVQRPVTPTPRPAERA